MWRRRCLTVALPIVLAPMLWFAALAGEVLHYAHKVDTRPADAAIVLGAAVWGDRPSPVFEERIRHGIRLYRTWRVGHIVFTGGADQRGEEAESVVAREYALGRGAPAACIVCEKQSRNTYENLARAKRIVEENGWDRVLIVSDPLHMRRAMMIARDIGLEAYSSPTETTLYRSWDSKIPFLLKEAALLNVVLFRRARQWSIGRGAR